MLLFRTGRYLLVYCVFALLLFSGGCTAQNLHEPIDVDKFEKAAAAGPINSFKECVEAGYPVMRSYPAKCATKEGKIFVDEAKLKEPKRACKDLCGNGTCEEIVCAAVGCPCPESAENCPEDCAS